MLGLKLNHVSKRGHWQFLQHMSNTEEAQIGDVESVNQVIFE